MFVGRFGPFLDMLCISIVLRAVVFIFAKLQIVHHGLTPQSGHYTAMVTLGDYISVFDDSTQYEPTSMQISDLFQKCTLLFFNVV